MKEYEKLILFLTIFLILGIVVNVAVYKAYNSWYEKGKLLSCPVPVEEVNVGKCAGC